MATTDKLFAGSIPELYDRFLVPLIFESCARDLAERLAKVEPQDVLETAAGTGVLTRAIASRLPSHVRIVATDLNQPMLDHAAARHPGNSMITWQQADALALPFADGRFDAVACQFGVMFFPSPIDGVREMLRVLKPNRKLAMAVWHSPERNPFHYVLSRVVDRYVTPAPVPDDSPEAFRFARPGKLLNVLSQAGAAASRARSGGVRVCARDTAARLQAGGHLYKVEHHCLLLRVEPIPCPSRA
jgi:SAM-dependent methyltransferase